jgi:hypothetical protein
MNPNPSALSSWPAFMLTLSTVLLTIVFVLWFSVFLLNRLLETDRQSEREQKWTLRRHLAFGGAVLVALAVLISVQYAFYYEPYVPPTYGGSLERR